MTLEDLRRIARLHGWQEMSDDPDISLWVMAGDHETTVVHAIQRQADVQVRAVTRARPRKRLRWDEFPPAPAAARAATMDADGAAVVLRGGWQT